MSELQLDQSYGLSHDETLFTVYQKIYKGKDCLLLLVKGG